MVPDLLMVILVVMMVMALTLVSFHGHGSVVVMMAWTQPGLKGAMVMTMARGRTCMMLPSCSIAPGRTCPWPPGRICTLAPGPSGPSLV